MRTFVAATVLAATVSLLAATGASAAPVVGGCSVFPDFTGSPKAKSAADQSAWNQDITKAPVHKRSKEIIRQINRDGGTELHPDFGGNGEYGIPFEVVPQSQPNVQVTIGPDGYPDESDFTSAPIPDDARIEGGPDSDGDRHVLVVQQGSCGLFELYRAFPRFTSTAAWVADATAFFDLNQAGPLRPAGFTSADAAGLPIFPGLVRFDEVAAGSVEHAIRDHLRRDPPGLHPAGNPLRLGLLQQEPAADGDATATEGQLLTRRTSKDFPEGSQSRPIFEAFRHYGVINADNGSNWYFQGSMDERWDDDDVGRLKDIPGSAFQVVKSAAKEKTSC